MAAIIAWVQANWMEVGVVLIAIDQILIGIFPSVPFLGSLKGILQSIFGVASSSLKGK